ncbi:MAG TPA: hypothetical protein VI756_25840 [Blastocatellia bacterium]
MNPTIIEVIAVVLAVFGANWLNQRNTAALLDQAEKRFDANFSAINQRLDRIERQLEALFKPALPDRH